MRVSQAEIRVDDEGVFLMIGPVSRRMVCAILVLASMLASFCDWADAREFVKGNIGLEK